MKGNKNVIIELLYRDKGYDNAEKASNAEECTYESNYTAIGCRVLFYGNTTYPVRKHVDEEG